jgi:asparagine synthase (glutamine-hydrolysing)
LAEAAMAADVQSYLPDDILVKVDRASMGVSLEARVPLLDPDLYAYAWRLPMHMKIRAGISKWALRQVLYRHVPAALVERPKSGFGIPIEHWLRGPLRQWAEHQLDEERLRQGGYFNPRPVRQRWSEHLTGRRNWQYNSWSVLGFEAWRDEYGVA